MGFAAIPFLITIITAIWTVIKTIWEVAKQRAVMLALWFGAIFPWIIKFVIRFFSWRYALWAVIAVLVGQAVTSALTVVRQLPQIQAVFNDFVDMFPGVGWFLWEGPMQLHVLLDGVPGMITTWVACEVGCFIVRKVKWAVQIGLANVLKNTP